MQVHIANFLLPLSFPFWGHTSLRIYTSCWPHLGGIYTSCWPHHGDIYTSCWPHLGDIYTSCWLLGYIYIYTPFLGPTLVAYIPIPVVGRTMGIYIYQFLVAPWWYMHHISRTLVSLCILILCYLRLICCKNVEYYWL